MKKRAGIFALVFALCAVLLCVGAAATGTTYYSIWIGDVQVSSENANDILDDGGTVSYDAMSNTLTLNNANLVYTSYDAVIISNEESLNINIVGDNTVSATDEGYWAIYASGELTLSGTGTLHANGKDYYPAIQSDGVLSIIGGTYDISDPTGTAMGLYAENDILITGDANVTVSTELSSGIYAYIGDLTISGENTNVTANVNDSGTALAADGAINISGGTVYATSATGNAMYAVSGGIHISGGYVEAISKSNRPAVNAPGIVEITGGELRAEAWGSIAIQATNEHDPFGEFVVTNAKVTAISHPVGSTNPPPAIYAPADIRITNSEVHAESEGYGIFTNGSMYISNSVVNSISARGWALASRGEEGIFITDSVIKAESPEGLDTVYCNGQFAADGSWVDLSDGINVISQEQTQTDSVVFTGIDGQVTGNTVVFAIMSSDEFNNFGFVYCIKDGLVCIATILMLRGAN